MCVDSRRKTDFLGISTLAIALLNPIVFVARLRAGRRTGNW
jgi:hypothetical protein